VAEAFRESWRYGRDRMDEIIALEAPLRGFAPEFVEEYLTRRIVNELGPREYQGMDLFLSYARQLGPSGTACGLPRSNAPV
jgi:predicted solute-binding protein